MSQTIQRIADDLYEARRSLVPIDHIRHRLPDGDLDAAYAISEINTGRRAQELRERIVHADHRGGVEEARQGLGGCIHGDRPHCTMKSITISPGSRRRYSIATRSP